MQNYEELLASLQDTQKALKDAAAAAVKQQKALQKSLDTGSLTDAGKCLDALREAIAQLQAQSQAAREAIAAFDTREYFASGDFTRQLLEKCAEKEVNVQGEKGVYEMFPFRIRVLGDAEHPGEVWMDRKKLASCRPVYVAETVRAAQARLYGASFKAESFMNELADAYETACLKANAHPGSNQSLTKLHKYMTPMARARKDYDLQAFAFDLARLYERGPQSWVSKNGTHFDFGTSRDGSTGIRVLSHTGAESYISTLRSRNSELN